MALREQADRQAGIPHQAAGRERGGIDLRVGRQTPGVDQSLHPTEIHHGVAFGKDVFEAALRQPAIKRHLAALEPQDRHAGTGLLSLHAPATGLALAGADTATDAHPLAAGTGVVGKFIKLHVFVFPWGEPCARP